MAKVKQTLESKFLNLLLEDQALWDSKYFADILDMPFDRQLSYYLNNLAMYTNVDQFKLIMQRKSEHEIKTKFIIILLSLLNQNVSSDYRSLPDLNELSFKDIFEQIYLYKLKWDRSDSKTDLYFMYRYIYALYEKIVLNSGLVVLKWIDNYRLLVHKKKIPIDRNNENGIGSVDSNMEN